MNDAETDAEDAIPPPKEEEVVATELRRRALVNVARSAMAASKSVFPWPEGTISYMDHGPQIGIFSTDKRILGALSRETRKILGEGSEAIVSTRLVEGTHQMFINTEALAARPDVLRRLAEEQAAHKAEFQSGLAPKTVTHEEAMAEADRAEKEERADALKTLLGDSDEKAHIPDDDKATLPIARRRELDEGMLFMGRGGGAASARRPTEFARPVSYTNKDGSKVR